MEIAARFELKYILSHAERDALLGSFPGRVLPDTLGGPSGHYPVVSLYYDSADRKCYWEAWRGVPSRRKLRLRLYGTKDGAIPAATFLEIKHRGEAQPQVSKKDKEAAKAKQAAEQGSAADGAPGDAGASGSSAQAADDNVVDAEVKEVKKG